jgi:hypothetical protein
MNLPDIIALIDQFEVFILLGLILGVFAFKTRIIAYLRKTLGYDQLRLDVLQNRLLQNIHLTPEKASVIESDFTLYKSLGGNGYMEQVYKEWQDTAEKQLVHKRVSKRGYNS